MDSYIREDERERFLLFTMPNCGECLKKKHILDKREMVYTEIDVTKNYMNKELAKKYNIKMAGTIIDTETGEEVDLDVESFAKNLNEKANKHPSITKDNSQ